jgi:DNA-binding NtrC family response regulator
MLYDRKLSVDDAEALLDATAARRPEPTTAKPTIVGSSGLSRELQRAIGKIAAMDSHVLVQGERGTGKTLVARSVHTQSRRADLPFLTAYCAESAELVNAELFGVDQGERPPRKGVFDLADGGTVFLDMIEDCPAETQRRLSAYLEDGYFNRDGSPRPVFRDVRLIAATDGGLKDKVDAGRFRSELYYRLGVAVLQTPPLRDCPEDIPVLVEHFLRTRAERDGSRPPAVSRDAAEMLRAFAWPDNVAQLAGVIDRAASLCDGAQILPEHLPDLAA